MTGEGYVDIDKLKEKLQLIVSDEVSKKEKELRQLEEKVEKIFPLIKDKSLSYGNRVVLDVGGKRFVTSWTVLAPDNGRNFFHGLKNPDLQQPEKGEPYFIPRDGESFQYVLEYLIYGELLSTPSHSVLKKLIKDADYYLLPELAQQANEIFENLPPNTGTGLMKSTGSNPKWVRLHGATLGGTGQNWANWQVDGTLSDCYELKTTSYTNDTLVVKMDGLYHMSVTTAVSTSTNHYSSLCINSTEKIRSHNSSCSNYSHSFHISDTFQLKANDQITIAQTYNGSPLNGSIYNHLTAIKLD